MDTIQADFTTTDVFAWNWQSEHRYNINQGGTWSSKTRSLMQVMLMHGVTDPGSRGTIVGQDFPHLRDGVIDDFMTVWKSSRILKNAIFKYNKGEKKIYFNNGSEYYFKSYADEQKAKSGKRQYLFINEANGIDYAVYSKLEERTDKKVYIDYNPDTEFWAHRKVLPKKNAIRFISNCFDHNPHTPESVKKNILEKGANDPNYMRVYVYGLTGKIKGLVFKNVYRCDEFPKGARKVGFGIDWGYTNSPTVVVQLGLYKGRIYGKQLVYEYQLSTEDLVKRLKAHGTNRKLKYVCDSEDPKSIADLASFGYNAIPAKKGKGSVKHGIKTIKEYPGVWLTNSSTEWIDEGNKYKYIKLNEDTWSDEPEDEWNHCWDAARYWASEHIAPSKRRRGKSMSGSA